MRYGIAGVLVIMGGMAASAETYKGYEMPPFDVVDDRGAYEIRAYAPHVLASVRVSGSAQSAASQGFRTLAGYIFGRNEDNAKIAMTVPVQQVPDDGAYEISFIMPERYALDALPTPDADAIEFSVTQPERIAVAQFSGYATGTVMRRKAAELRDLIERDGLRIISGPRYAYYDDPFTLPWRRRNEVAFVLAR